LLIASTALIAGLVNSCSTQPSPTLSIPPPPNPKPATPSLSTGQPAVQLPSYGAPKVKSPLNLARFQQTPCDSILQDQVEEFLGSNAYFHPNPTATFGAECNVREPGGDQAGIQIKFNTVNHWGITNIYSKKGTDYPFFEPLEPIMGYPIAAYDIAQKRPIEQCTVALGTSDQETIDITVFLGKQYIGKKDPCLASHDVAVAVIDTVKGKQ
jgi:hypothetical protein